MFLPDTSPYALDVEEKAQYLSGQLRELVQHHRAHCPGYARLVEDWEQHFSGSEWTAEDVPFIPVTIFKEYDLRSTDQEVMSIRSSATTSRDAARIFVDKPTRKRQTLSANKVLADFIGEGRRPYLVFDAEKTVRGAESMSARGAAIMSLAHLASDFYFVMKEVDGELELDDELLADAVAAIGGQPFISYGFTYILYQVHQQMRERGLKWPAHSDSVFLHSGGWKRLQNIAVDKRSFNEAVSGQWGLPAEQVVDFYGAVEQIGVPYPDCSEGLKHVPYWADVIIRHSDSLRPAGVDEPGLMQLISCLPLSAPNHSVLTEDLGELKLLDGCPCGRRGKAFVFRGRAPRSEVRGCSDVTRH